MPKAASFSIRRKEGREREWYVEIPARHSESGKRERRFFETRDQAKGFAEAQRVRRSNFGMREVLLPPDVRRHALKAVELLRPFGIPLAEAVSEFVAGKRALEGIPATLPQAARFFAHDHRQKAASVPFSTLFNEFIESRRRLGCSESYLAQLRHVHKKVSGAIPGNTSVCDLTVRMVEDALVSLKLAAGTFNACRRILSAVFEFGTKRDFLPANPIKKIERARQHGRDVTVLTNNQVRALLASADDSLLPYLLVSIFAGLRPTEAARLQWERVDLEKGRLFVEPRANQKERCGRFVPLSKNLQTWLATFTKRSGPIVAAAAFRERFETARTRADELLIDSGCESEATLANQWVKDAMRHTAASNWSAVEEDIPKVSTWLGHAPEVHKKHYLRSLPREQADEFWNIGPTDGEGKVVPFRVA